MQQELRQPSVIALDLDGTLLQSDGTMSPRTLAAVQQCVKVGIKPVIATARPPRSVRRLLPPDFPAAPWACYIGAEIYDCGERIIQNDLSPEMARAIVCAISELAPKATISLEIDDQLFCSRPLKGPWLHQVVPDLFAMIDRPVATIIFDFTQEAELDAFRHRLPCACQLVPFLIEGDGWLANILAPGVSKALALEELVARWGLTMEEVIAFGDDQIDIEMLVKCGTGVAMGNASPEVRAIADIVTGTNDEDGVAQVLEQLVARAALSIEHSKAKDS